eukprot:gene5588-5557_t
MYTYRKFCCYCTTSQILRLCRSIEKQVLKLKQQTSNPQAATQASTSVPKRRRGSTATAGESSAAPPAGLSTELQKLLTLLQGQINELMDSDASPLGIPGGPGGNRGGSVSATAK